METGDRGMPATNHLGHKTLLQGFKPSIDSQDVLVVALLQRFKTIQKCLQLQK